MIYNAIVRSNFDLTRSGKLLVECAELGAAPCKVKIINGLPFIEGNCLQVTYTTPYYENYKSGMIAVPAENAEILIHHNSRTKASYYISTVVLGPTNAKSSDSKDRREDSVIEPMEYYQDGAPAGMTFKDPQGNGLGTYFKRSNERYVNKTDLINGKKKLSLDNSPEADCVKLDNGHGDYLKINGLPETSIPGVPHPSPQRSLEARTFLNQHFISDRGELDFKIMDGKEITLENRSSGFFSFGPLAPRTGNINLFSKYKNINIVAKAPFYVPTEGPLLGGSIRIETGNSEVIVSRTGVTIRMNTGLLLNSRPGQLIAGIGKPQITLNADTGDVLIDAGGAHNTPLEGGPSIGGKITLKGRQIELLAPNVVLGAEANITLAAGGTINATAGAAINTAAGGLVNIDGSLVNLNGGGGLAAIGVNASVLAEANSYVPELPVNVTPSEYPTGTKYF